jgi:hypothetical protein
MASKVQARVVTRASDGTGASDRRDANTLATVTRAIFFASLPSARSCTP